MGDSTIVIKGLILIFKTRHFESISIISLFLCYWMVNESFALMSDPPITWHLGPHLTAILMRGRSQGFVIPFVIEGGKYDCKLIIIIRLDWPILSLSFRVLASRMAPLKKSPQFFKRIGGRDQLLMCVIGRPPKSYIISSTLECYLKNPWW